MSRRFSDEPINLIRRIPSPEQLDAARPVKRSFGAKFGDAAASFARSIAERLTHVTSPKQPGMMVASNSAPQGEPDAATNEVVASECDLLDRKAGVAEPQRSWPAEAADDGRKLAAALSSIQPEELAELRGYLLKQQQDIVRLAAQIQELKSLVISQQHLIEYLGKEGEAGCVSLRTTGLPSVVAKHTRAPRQKPGRNGKAAMSKDDPMRLPLNV